MTSVDFADDQPHIAHANAIAVTGVPLLSLATSIFNVSTLTSIPAGGSLTIPGGPFTINQIGYELFVKVLANAAAAFPFVRVVLTWSDSVSGNVVSTVKGSLSAGSPTSQTVQGTGPTAGDTLSVTVFNDDTTVAVQVAMSMVQNSRVYVRDDWRNGPMQPIPNLTRGNYSLDSGVLVNVTTTTNAGITAARTIGLYAGLVSVTFSGTQAYQLQIQAHNGEVSTLIPTIVFETIVAPAAGGLVQLTAQLPRCVSELVWTNNGGAAGSFTGTVCLGEQQP